MATPSTRLASRSRRALCVSRPSSTISSDVEVFADLDSPIHVFDRGYLDYDRFCELKERETDFICFSKQTLVSTSWNTSRTSRLPTTREHDISVMNGLSLPKLANNSAASSSKMLMARNPAYLTTLSSAYAPVEVMSIYTLRTMIEILFRELKQYTNIESFHSQSLNGVLFEIFCTLIGYVLVEWFRQRHPLRVACRKRSEQFGHGGTHRYDPTAEFVSRRLERRRFERRHSPTYPILVYVGKLIWD